MFRSPPKPHSEARHAGPLILGSLLLGLSASAVMAQSPRVVLTPAEGYSISWDGNNGAFSSPELGALAPDNAALLSYGTLSFASSSFLPGGVHDAFNVNDGYYGNSSSWIADFTADPPDTDPFVGLVFGRTVDLESIAWGRDNGDDTESTPPGPFTDRAVGVYTLQFTQDPFPSTFTAESDDPATGWATIGTVEYLPGANSIFFSAYLRHRFDVALANGNPIAATGIRIKVSDVGTCIDEIEVNPPADPAPPLSSFLSIASGTGFSLNWGGNEGIFSDPVNPATAPAHAGQGEQATVIASSTAGEGSAATNVRDGMYGAANAWSPLADGSDPAPYIGYVFAEPIVVRNIAWSRDNQGASTGQSLGTYTVQVTRVANPDGSTPESEDPNTGWATLGTADYKQSGDSFQAHLRHRFEIATDAGQSVLATGIRLVLSTDQIAIDEFEVNINQANELGLVQIESQPGFEVSWDGNNGEFFSGASGASAPENDASISTGATAFGSSELGLDTHFINNVNDGLYGNFTSWISGTGLAPDPFIEEFVGIQFNRTVEISSIAWGRDNGNITDDCCGGTLRDRAIGIYTLQFTRLASPDVNTFETGDPESGWATIATIEYVGTAPPEFEPHLRHRFDVSQNGSPVSATAIRFKVAPASNAIDEIEVNPPPVPSVSPVAIASNPPYNIAWDGNEGLFSNPNAVAPPPRNAALASSGTVAFGSTELDLGVHFIPYVNDGQYGNSSSWIADFINGDSAPFIGLRFNRSVPILNIAWSRDNGNDTERDPPGPFTDRFWGVYTLQFTRVPQPGTSTTDTGDPTTGWATLGSVTYQDVGLPFGGHLRHRFEVGEGDGALEATGIRILVSDPNIAIDEIEVNAIENLRIAATSGYQIQWDGREGDYFSPDAVAPAPDNIGLSSRGSVAFASSQLDFGVHYTPSLNDGLYGNSASWIADFALPDPDPFAGIIFPESVLIENIAWGRDNGNNETDCCNGQLMDRASGVYTLQITTVPTPDPFQLESEDPAMGWTTVGTVNYGAATPLFSPWLRHRFHVSQGGEPIAATALRIKVSSNQIAIDEIEVNTPAPEAPAALVLSYTQEGSILLLTWEANATLHSAPSIDGPWTAVDGATSPHSVDTATNPAAYFQLIGE